MELRDIPVPQPKYDEYLIKVEACGICGSDVEGFLGKTGRRTAPMIMGHEFAGIVEKAPKGGAYETGSKVAVFPKFYCGECETCKKGFVNLCPHANFLGVMDCDGAMTEYLYVKEHYLIPYSGVGANVASMTEPAAVAYGAVSKLSDRQIAEARNIFVVGAGTIGLLALSWLKYRGAGRVICSDASNYRLELASRMGADAVVNPMECEFTQKISELTGGEMCDISVEAVGINPTAQASVDALKNSGLSIWIGNAAKMVSVNMQSIVTKELQIKGSYIYSFEDFKICVKLLSEKAIDVLPIITHRMDLSKGVEAFETLRDNKDGKAVKIILTTA
ncbi:MAG: alcohol dehydrogenase catalytic domain-containing protein [Clostridia bacterium]|nr:alcohol dehydrogenase catalytic domain-containing protein [Clostridia bacterium]